MAIVSVVYGRSGTGKSYSLHNFQKDEILYVNIEKKPLPFRGGKFTYTGTTTDVNSIIKWAKEAYSKGVKIMVVDDATYLMVKPFMANHRIAKGNSQFDMYNTIADNMYNLIEGSKDLPGDMTVYIILHEQETNSGTVKIKTIGKLLDDKCPVAEALTIMLRSGTDGKKHWFATRNDGTDETKTPVDMFEEDKVANDLKMVDMAIREYYCM